MKSEARRLQSLQLAIDQHDVRCGCPIRALQLNPFERDRLDWDDFRGIPIETAHDLPTGVVRIDCLTTTIREAYEDFKDVARAGSQDAAIDAAEQRLEAKLEQLAEKIEQDWDLERPSEWWRKAAMREPDLYRRATRGEELTRNQKLRLELAQLPSARDRDLADLFESWDQAHADLGVNMGDLDRVSADFEQAWANLPNLLPEILPAIPKDLPARSLRQRIKDWWLAYRLRRDLRRIRRKLR